MVDIVVSVQPLLRDWELSILGRQNSSRGPGCHMSLITTKTSVGRAQWLPGAFGSRMLWAIRRTTVAQLGHTMEQAWEEGLVPPQLSIAPLPPTRNSKSWNAPIIQSSNSTLFPFVSIVCVFYVLHIFSQIFWFCFTKVYFIHNKMNLFSLLFLVILCTHKNPPHWW